MLRGMIYLCSALLIGMLWPAPVRADNYTPVGDGVYSNSSGKLFRKVWTDKKVDCGYGRYCYQRVQSWQAVDSTNASAKVSIYNVTPTTRNWRDHVASYAGAIKLEQQNHQDFLETVDALGLSQDNAYAQQYSQQQNQGYGQYAPGYYAPQGDTNYQLRYSMLSQLTSRSDPALAINQASNHIKGLQELLRESSSNLHSTIQMDVVGRNAAANTVANAMAASHATDSMANLVKVIGESGQGSSLTVQEIYHAIEAIKQINAKPAQPNNGVIVQSARAVRQNCARCHSGDTPDGDLVLDPAVPLTPEQFRRSIVHVNDRTMPPPGKIEEPLSSEEVGQVIRELTSEFTLGVPNTDSSQF